MRITMNKKYTYRNGEVARILCVDRPNTDIPIISMTAKGRLTFHKADGEVRGSVSEWNLVEEWTPQDKEPVWAWDKDFLFSKELRFFDAKNNRCFRMDGSREGPSFPYYAKVEHLEQWILNAQAKLQG